ncbi:MAG: hypothetical protein V2I33_25870 [Kangiellaceae bacterium]|jgi:hypothetical protein|nr:hypothetical protein [Kangiellaceae bacterium]
MRLFVNGDKRMGASLAKESHSVTDSTPGYTTHLEGTAATATNFTPIEKNTWYYLVYSFEMIDMTDTKITFFIDNVASTHGAKTFTETFIVDKAAYVGMLGIE